MEPEISQGDRAARAERAPAPGASFPFRRVLVANRGEIACRVFRTCRRLGLETVAVFSDADAEALHVSLADQAVRIGPAAPRESYLLIDAVVEAALASGADAVHPGYGFLSENPRFAEACGDAGLTFIGPSPEVIRAMGLKGAAKAVAEAAGVPVLPGAAPDDASDEALIAAADAVGYPVLIKAVAGGGGRGMRQAATPDALPAAIQSARREAASAFGDDRLLVERFLARARHIEVQVLADAHGAAVHLFERDCSLQRRHQKIVEETPSPGLSDEMRAAMGAAAVKLCHATQYRGVGTVEFIADVSEGLRPDRFWFMEMNTRLQVEHPVTEAVTGLDLVEQQLRVAAGLRLDFAQADLRLDGHAIEVRLCAENPARNYLPSPGGLTAFVMPGPPARVDTGLRAGDRVTTWYDNLLAKVIVHAPDRAAALAAMASALGAAQISGVAVNLDLLRAVVAHPSFCAGDVHTDFLAAHAAVLLAPRPADPTPT
jgi:3-methylcrotonyl-CoA carboxylase alpha subunit